jgi:hypothetical protein
MCLICLWEPPTYDILTLLLHFHKRNVTASLASLYQRQLLDNDISTSQHDILLSGQVRYLFSVMKPHSPSVVSHATRIKKSKSRSRRFQQ